MINSVTGTQAVIIEKYRKLEKDIDDIEDDVFYKSQNQVEKNTKNVDESKNSKQNQQTKSKNISDLLNEFTNRNDVTFDLIKDKESDEMILIIRDNKTEEIIQQIPSDLSLKIGRYITEKYGIGQLTNERI